IADLVLELLGLPSELRVHVAERPGQVDRHIGSTQKAERLLGWRARASFAEGLERTVAWYRDNGAWWRGVRTRARSASSSQAPAARAVRRGGGAPASLDGRHGACRRPRRPVRGEGPGPPGPEGPEPRDARGGPAGRRRAGAGRVPQRRGDDRGARRRPRGDG